MTQFESKILKSYEDGIKASKKIQLQFGWTSLGLSIIYLFPMSEVFKYIFATFAVITFLVFAGALITMIKYKAILKNPKKIVMINTKIKNKNWKYHKYVDRIFYIKYFKNQILGKKIMVAPSEYKELSAGDTVAIIKDGVFKHDYAGIPEYKGTKFTKKEVVL